MSAEPKRIVCLTLEEPKFIGVIIDAPTGVIYSQQCGGTNCYQNDLEGYFVPVSRYDLDESDMTSDNRLALDTDLLKAVFHDAVDGDPDACIWPWAASAGDLPVDRLDRLAALVALLCYRGAGYEEKMLALDYLRLADGCEACVPVVTPDGPGTLVWNNCD